MGQLVNIMESPVRRLTFGEMGDSYPKGRSNALGDDAESKAYRSKFIDDGVSYKDRDLNPFFAETTRTVDGSPTQILNADDNYRIQCSYFECYSVQDLYRFYIEPNIILASNKLQTQIDTINGVISKLADNSNSTTSKRTNGLVSKDQWGTSTQKSQSGAPVLFTSGKGYVAKASTGNLGVVKNGTNTSIGSNGEVNVPTATGGDTNPLGVVKQGNHVTIGGDGTLSANKATSSEFGVVKPGNNIIIRSGSNGVLDVPVATKNIAGVVKVGDNLTIDINGKLSATDTDTTYPSADDTRPDTQGTVKTGSGISKGDISWKDGVGRVRGYQGFRLNPDNGEVIATPTLAVDTGEDGVVAYLNLSNSNNKFYESPFISESRDENSLYLSGPRKIIYPVDPGSWINADLNLDPVFPKISKCILGTRFDYKMIKRALDSFGILDIELEFLHPDSSRDIGTSAQKLTVPSILWGLTWGGFRLWDFTGFLDNVTIYYFRPPRASTTDSIKEVIANIGSPFESGAPFTKEKWNGNSSAGDKYTPAVCIPTYANRSIAVYEAKSLNFRFKVVNGNYMCDIYPHLIYPFNHNGMVTPGW